MIGLNQCKLLDGGTTFFKGSTCLVEACLNRDMGMIDLLLKYGARDDDCKVRIIELTMKSLTYLFVLFDNFYIFGNSISFTDDQFLLSRL